MLGMLSVSEGDPNPLQKKKKCVMGDKPYARNVFSGKKLPPYKMGHFFLMIAGCVLILIMYLFNALF